MACLLICAYVHPMPSTFINLPTEKASVLTYKYVLVYDESVSTKEQWLVE